MGGEARPLEAAGKGWGEAAGRPSIEVGVEPAPALVRAQRRACRLIGFGLRVVALVGTRAAFSGVQHTMPPPKEEERERRAVFGCSSDHARHLDGASHGSSATRGDRGGEKEGYWTALFCSGSWFGSCIGLGPIACLLPRQARTASVGLHWSRGGIRWGPIG